MRHGMRARSIARVALMAALGFVVSGARLRDSHAATTARLVYLRGQGAESCPNESELREVVAARLGYDPFTPFSLDTLFTEVDKDGLGFVARVKLVSHENVVRGARTLQTRGGCADLIASLALTISLAIDPMAISRKGLPDGLPPGERPVDVTITPAERSTADPPLAPPTAATPTPGPRVRLQLGGGFLGSVGAAPSAAIGFVAFGGVRLGDASALLEARADLPASGSADGPGTVASSLLALSLLACAHVSTFFGCARGTVGSLSAESVDVRDPGSASALWGAVGARLGLAVPLTSVLALRLHGDADVVLTRYALRIGERTAFPYPPLAAALGAALVVTFQ